jgi:hypothetical protein
MSAADLIQLEIALLPEEIKVLEALATAGGNVIAAIRARQAGNPQPQAAVSAGDAAWDAIMAMSVAHGATPQAS